MATARWFDGVECAGCGFPLFFHEDTSGGRSLYSPAAPLVIRCTNPTCGREEDYYGRTHKKFRVELQ
jgi:Zn-finger protein